MTITLHHIKIAAKFITFLGVSKVSSDIIAATANNPTALSKAMSFAGGVVVGTIATDYATKYIENFIDETAATINEINKRKQEKKNAA